VEIGKRFSDATTALPISMVSLLPDLFCKGEMLPAFDWLADQNCQQISLNVHPATLTFKSAIEITLVILKTSRRKEPTKELRS